MQNLLELTSCFQDGFRSIESDYKNATKWCNYVVKQCMQHMIESWDERNLQVRTEASCKANLKQRVLEFFHNRKECDHEINEFVEDARDKMEEMTKDQLCVKIDFLRDKVKKGEKDEERS